MGDHAGSGPKKINLAIIGFVVSACLAAVSWGLLAQSWAKDAGHQVILERIDRNADISTRNEVINSGQQNVLDELVKITERLVVAQEAMQKQLDRIERMVSP